MSAACLLERYISDEGQGSLKAEACEYPPPVELEMFDYEHVRRHIREQYFDRPLSSLEIEQKRMQLLKAGKFNQLRHMRRQTQELSYIPEDARDNLATPSIDVTVPPQADGKSRNESPSQDKHVDKDVEDSGEPELDEEMRVMLLERARRRKRGTLRKLR